MKSVSLILRLATDGVKFSKLLKTQTVWYGIRASESDNHILYCFGLLQANTNK